MKIVGEGGKYSLINTYENKNTVQNFGEEKSRKATTWKTEEDRDPGK
jgi:hypothetical protein